MNEIAVLTYSAPAEQLSGKIGDRYFSLIAYSGGGRGSVKALHSGLSLKTHYANTKKIGSQRGGTLPSGHYLCHYIAHHPKFHECIWLQRCLDAASVSSPASLHSIAHNRGDDFFIHGRGEHGSDGCIVPKDPQQRLALNAAIKSFPGKTYVHVVGTAYLLPAENMSGVITA